MKKNKLQRGFSLAETIVYVAVFSILVVGLTNFSNSLTSTRLHTQTVLEVNDQGSNIIKIITQTLRNANQVNSPTIGNTASSLSVVTPNAAISPSVFSQSGGVLYITEGSGSLLALTNNKVVVSNLIFSNLSRPSTPNIIRVGFTLTSVSTYGSVGSYTVTFSGSGALRK